MNYVSIVKSINITIIALCLITILIMVIEYANLKSKLTHQELQNISLNKALDNQNKAIQKLYIDIETYKAKKPEIKEKIIYKYKSLPVSNNNSCVEILDSIKLKVKTWYGVQE